MKIYVPGDHGNRPACPSSDNGWMTSLLSPPRNLRTPSRRTHPVSSMIQPSQLSGHLQSPEREAERLRRSPVWEGPRNLPAGSEKAREVHNQQQQVKCSPYHHDHQGPTLGHTQSRQSQVAISPCPPNIKRTEDGEKETMPQASPCCCRPEGSLPPREQQKTETRLETHPERLAWEGMLAKLWLSWAMIRSTSAYKWPSTAKPWCRALWRCCPG
ncbi:hypothetical protein MC885_020293 [Smutsia gigantea]|nr:hypothetical protein MC885_020293 [Smutsia gigantea]